MESLDGKTAVVTGGASGMGRAMAKRFAKAGMAVAVADVDEEGMARVVAEIESDGGRAMAKLTDVADADANDALASAALEAFGAINVVCLNAGVTGTVGRSWTLSEQDWRWSLGILLDGVSHGIRSFVPSLLEHDDGHVVITASIAGHVSAPFSGPYAVAKHGAAALAETLYHELQSDKSQVGVTCLCPGFVNTNIVRSARNRSEQGPGTAIDDRGERWMDFSEMALESGLDPELVGDMVHDAILAKQFWLFTDKAWDQAIARRAEEIVNRLPPTVSRYTSS